MKKKLYFYLLPALVIVVTIALVFHVNNPAPPEVLMTYYSTGELQSRSEAENGKPHGWSEGYYTSGQIQVREYFVKGVSDGTRIKWYPSGNMKSETEISDGKLNGYHRVWHEGGGLAVDARYVDGEPHGQSVSYHPSGALKSKVVMDRGEVVSQVFYDESGGQMVAGSSP